MEMICGCVLDSWGISDLQKHLRGVQMKPGTCRRERKKKRFKGDSSEWREVKCLFVLCLVGSEYTNDFTNDPHCGICFTTQLCTCLSKSFVITSKQLTGGVWMFLSLLLHAGLGYTWCLLGLGVLHIYCCVLARMLTLSGLHLVCLPGWRTEYTD